MKLADLILDFIAELNEAAFKRKKARKIFSGIRFEIAENLFKIALYEMYAPETVEIASWESELKGHSVRLRRINKGKGNNLNLNINAELKEFISDFFEDISDIEFSYNELQYKDKPLRKDIDFEKLLKKVREDATNFFLKLS
jgi:hypothetical protein